MTPVSNPQNYGNSALDAELAAMRSTGNGGRNCQLFKSAAAISGLEAANVPMDPHARHLLIEAAKETGLEEREIAGTIKSGWEAGRASPRAIEVRQSFKPANGAPIGKPRTTGTYEYDDGTGEVLYRTRRVEQDGKAKRFVAERLVDGQWIAGIEGVDRCLYRFTEICVACREARERGEAEPPIYLVEGERKADKLAGWGLLATAVAFGANGWLDEYAEALTGSPVFILPDNDEAGAKFAAKAKASIEATGGTVTIIELPGLPHKGDIMDWTGTPDELAALVAKAEEGEDEPLPSLDLAALANVEPKPVEFVIESIAPKGEVVLFTGPGSAGKSLLSQQLATAAASGLNTLGLAVAPCPALYVTCEDSDEQLHWRHNHICEAMGVDRAAMASRLRLTSLRGGEDNALCTFNPDGRLKATTAYSRLVRQILTMRAGLVLLDNLAHLFTGNENDRGQVTQFVNLLNRLAGETSATIVLLGHPNKAGDAYSGSTAWLNAVRSQFTIDHVRDADGSIPDPDERLLTLNKANYSAKGATVTFRWHRFAFILLDDLPRDMAAQIAANVQANVENDRFLECLAKATDERRATSPNKSASNYAPRVFTGMTTGKGIGERGYAAAMERLLHLGTIRNGEKVYQRDNRTWALSLSRADESAQTLAQTPAQTDAQTCTNPHIPHTGNLPKAARTHPPISKDISGAGPWGSPAPDHDDREAGE